MNTTATNVLPMPEAKPAAGVSRGWLREMHDAIERAFFPTLTRKIAGTFAVPVLALVAIGATAWRAGADGASTLVALAAVGALLTLLSGVYLCRLLVRPIRRVNFVVARMASEQGDLSQRLEVTTQDELAVLARNFNEFLDKLARIVEDVRKQSFAVSLESVKVAGRVRDSAVITGQQREHTERIFALATDAGDSLADVTTSADQIAQATEGRMKVAEQAYRELLDVTERVRAVGKTVEAFTGTVGELDQNSRNIGQIVKLINDISDQTNLLALNAAIEAARAGEVGRGFAVVADEVRKLAEKVKQATDVIAGSVANMAKLVESTQRETAAIRQGAEHTQAVVERSSQHFEGMVASFSQMRGQVDTIGGAIAGLARTHEAIHGAAGDIRSLTGEVAGKMERSELSSRELSNATERIAEVIAQVRVGHGRFEKLIDATRRQRDRIAAALEALAARGVDVFDTRYVPIEGTSPQKYRTSYDADCEHLLQPLYDELVAEIDGGIFALAVDVNAYAPTHNRKYSQRPTGDPKVDLVSSRDKRIFDDPTGSRAAKSTQPMLLQTYRRDTGEILNDLSVPIVVRGRHWGALRFGFKPEVLLEV